MKAWRRGLLPTAYTPNGMRDIARRELILSMMSAEDDAETARDTAFFAVTAYGPHVSGDSRSTFLKKYSAVLRYAAERAEYRKSDWSMVDPEQALANDPVVRRMVERFKYMQEHGMIPKE